MALLTKIEKEAFYNLFNRGGYVLDFSTPTFNDFTRDSVGVALCEKYGVSKGQSLYRFLNDAEEQDILRLLVDLFDHYEFNFESEINSNSDYAGLYKKCKPVIEKIKSAGILNTYGVSDLRSRFSSDYISSQIDLMLRMQNENPTEAIGKAKELIESCCKTILEDNGIDGSKSWDVNKLVDETCKFLHIVPDDIPDNLQDAKAMKAILGNLKAIASNIASLRNNYGSGHGKSASFKGLQERHAKLAIGSSITLTNFLWDSYDRKKN